MPGTLDMTGQLTAAPACNQGSALPGSIDNVAYALNPACKAWAVKTGDAQANVASPNAYVALQGVGASGPVTKANFLLLRTVAGLAVRLTFVGGATAVLPLVAGLLVCEPAAGLEIILVEVMGTDTVEYFASGAA